MIFAYFITSTGAYSHCEDHADVDAANKVSDTSTYTIIQVNSRPDGLVTPILVNGSWQESASQESLDSLFESTRFWKSLDVNVVVAKKIRRCVGEPCT